MTPEDLEDKYGFLWDGSGDWAVQRYHYDEANLTVVFAGEHPTIRELAALRKTFPQYSQIPVHELKEFVGTTGRFDLGTFSSYDEHGLRPHLARSGLTIESKWNSYDVVQLVNEADRRVLKIEEEAERQFVCQRMIEEGHRIGTIEVD